MKEIVIIGSGAAGLTAAIYSARAKLEPVVISGELPGGQLTQTTEVENYPGFPDGGIDGTTLMESFRKQAEDFDAEIVSGKVKGAELKKGGTHRITLGNGDEIETRALIIATGASPRWLGLESEERLKGKGVTSCATCDGAFYKDVPVVVVGGGDSAMEEALFLTRFASKVTVIHRRGELRASKIMGDRAKKNDKIEFSWDTVVTEVLGDDRVEGVRVKNVKSEEESTMECEGYFAALGHIPNTQVFKDQIALDDRGYIKLEEGRSYTSLEGVFAAGDCADYIYRQAVTAAGMGCKAAIDAERWLESIS